MTWKTFFLKIHTRNVVQKLFSDPFLKNQNWACLWIHICWGYQLTGFYMRATLAFHATSFFKKTKRGLELISLLHFLHDFSRKVFILLYSSLVAFTSWDFGKLCVLHLFVKLVVSSYILKLILSFESRCFFYVTKKSRQIFKYLKNKKRF